MGNDGEKQRILYLNPTKEQKEESLFDSFIALESNISDGKWDKSEAPDYLLTTKNIVIGLEITTLTEPKAQNQYEMTAIRTAQDKAIRMAKEVAVKNNLPPLKIEVKYKDDRTGVDVDIASQELYNLVEEYQKIIDDSKRWYKDTINSKIFDGFSIRLSTSNGIQWLPDHLWSRFHRNWVGIDPLSEIQNCIDTKHKKLTSYLEKCDKCCLLIGVDEWTAPEAFDLSENGINHCFKSKFERVYFLRNIERKLYQLKLG